MAPGSLPVPKLQELTTGVFLLEPLSKRGVGPGMIVLTSQSDVSSPEDKLLVKDGVPSAIMKWAEEGYTVVEITKTALQDGTKVLDTAIEALSKCDYCEPKDQFCLRLTSGTAYDPDMWNEIAPEIAARTAIAGVVVYGDASHQKTIVRSSIPSVHHLAGKATSKLERSGNFTAYNYPSMKTCLFATPHQKSFHYSSESVSHTRNLTFLKKLLDGPYFDLEAIWDEHTFYEFGERSVEKTMATMVQEPYVNHIPTITGGIGRRDLTQFYTHHFIFSNPDDAELELISRTVGVDRVVDEFIYKITHDKEVDWLIPGVPPTYKYLEVPMMAVVNIRGDRLYHEHISWDQGTVLAQCGLMPEYLPFIPGDDGSGEKRKEKTALEFKVPVAGRETAMKMRDKESVGSNEMFTFRVREVTKTS